MEPSREDRGELAAPRSGSQTESMPVGEWHFVLVTGNSWEAALQYHQTSDRVRIIGVGIKNAEERQRAAEAGVLACVDWTDSIGDLVRVLNGSDGTLISAMVSASESGGENGWPPDVDPRLELARNLPTTLLEIAVRRSFGATGREIAAATHRSEKTVKTHFQRLNRRLGLTSVRVLQEWRPALVAAWRERTAAADVLR